jgi:predicted kinase
MNLFLIRGLPGSGKSTLAKQLGLTVFEADQFFMKDGVYQFDPSLLAEAHKQCQENTFKELSKGNSVCVANTFTKRWEMQPYIEMADVIDARLTVVSLFDGGLSDEQLAARNTHGVPLAAIQAMRSRWQEDWKNGK